MSSLAVPVPGAARIIINQVENPKQEEEKQQQLDNYVDDEKGNHDLPEDLKTALKDLLTHYGTIVDKQSRRTEIIDARRQRHYDRGDQYIYFDGRANVFVPVTGGVLLNVGSESVQMPRYCNVYNIFKPYRRNFSATLTQNPPGVNFEPKDPTNSLDIRIAEAAQNYSHHYDQINDTKKLQAKMARLFWTDGRVVGWTRHEKNGQKFGTYQKQEDAQIESQDIAEADDLEQREQESTGEQPEAEAKGEEVTTLYGVLEAKCFPITANTQDELIGVIISDDPEINSAKEQYDWIEEEIHAGESGSGETAFERNARIGVLQGRKMWSQSRDSYAHLVERNRMFLRPSAFRRAKAGVREKLKEVFPRGVEIVFISGNYAESFNRSLDDCLKVDHALDGDGMNRPSWGKDHVPVQDAYNNYRNMRQEYHDYGIPATFYESSIADPNSWREKISQPGELIAVSTDQPGAVPIANYFYTPPPASPPADLVEAEQDLRDALSQLITGVQPSLFGGQIAKDDRVGVYQMAREQAMGVMSMPWGVMQSMIAGFKYQAVLAAGRTRKAEESLKVIPSRQAGLKKKPITVSISDLTKGNFRAVPDTDSSFPTTRQMKKQALQEIATAGAEHPMIQEALMQPDNMELAAELEGIPEFDFPAARAWRRQKDEIDTLLSTTPIPPTLQQLQAVSLMSSMKAAAQASSQGQAAGQQPPVKAPSPEEYALAIASKQWTPEMISMAKCSLDADEEDFHQYHIMSIKDWFNSTERDKEIDDGNQLGILNLRLHKKQHEKFAQQEQGNNEGDQKVSASLNFKDLPPSGKIQLAAKEGIQLTPQDVMPVVVPQPGAAAPAM